MDILRFGEANVSHLFVDEDLTNKLVLRSDSEGKSVDQSDGDGEFALAIFDHSDARRRIEADQPCRRKLKKKWRARKT